MYIYIYVNHIKTANNAVGDLVFFFFCKSCDSRNKMTNAAYENAMGQCPRN